MNQSQKSLANICRFCGERLSSPSMCTYCGFKFCDDHKPTEAHQCIKTRYSEYIRKSNPNEIPNMASGNFRVVCEMCGFTTSKGAPIEYAGEELIQHTQIVGCSEKIFLVEEKEPIERDSIPSPDSTTNQEKIKLEQIQQLKNSNTNQSTSIVDQIIKLSELKEKGIISEQEFSNIKKELIKKLSQL
jgi:hypothetical protein